MRFRDIKNTKIVLTLCIFNDCLLNFILKRLLRNLVPLKNHAFRLEQLLIKSFKFMTKTRTIDQRTELLQVSVYIPALITHTGRLSRCIYNLIHRTNRGTRTGSQGLT